jgi:hypothetical protein
MSYLDSVATGGSKATPVRRKRPAA